MIEKGDYYWLIRKKHIKSGENSLIEAGEQFYGFEAILVGYPNIKETSKVNSTRDLKRGYQFVLFNAPFGRRVMNTSPIENILQVNKNSVLFETETSVYELVKIYN